MGKEIERKFLVTNDAYRAEATAAMEIKQAYLSLTPVVRVRRYGDRAYLTVKSPNQGRARGEWEYEIPVNDAEEMARLAGGWTIEKTRFLVPFHGKKWEVDEFSGSHAGLVMAEIELESETETFEFPAWCGREVTGDPAYYNSNLSKK